jgi:hypothetical protein
MISFKKRPKRFNRYVPVLAELETDDLSRLGTFLHEPGIAVKKPGASETRRTERLHSESSSTRIISNLPAETLSAYGTLIIWGSTKIAESFLECKYPQQKGYKLSSL